jgi:predicted butyrate kinase (DUF1464 family)
LGGAFTAAVAVENGRIVDGVGGTSGPLGVRASGALDGEVAFLAGVVSKDMLFGGGVLAIGGRSASNAYMESAVKAVAALAVSIERRTELEIVLSGRQANVPEVRDEFMRRFARAMNGVPVRVLTGLGATAKHAAQGAALIADGLSGGASAPLVETLGIREAKGTVLDHLYVIAPTAAKTRLGIT